MASLGNLAPGVYFQELQGPRSIQFVGTSTAAFVGQAPDAGAHVGEAVAINNPSQFAAEFASRPDARPTWLSHGVKGFFQNGGSRCFIVNIPDSEPISGNDRPRTGLKLLEEIDEVAIVAAPGRTDPNSHDALLSHCEPLGDRFCILDPPMDVTNTELLKTVETAAIPTRGAGKDKDKDKDKDAAAGGGTSDAGSSTAAGGLRPRISAGGYGAFYFPWLYVQDPLNPRGGLVAVPPSGHMAGIYARVDNSRGVFKAPANEIVRGALNLKYRVTSAEQADLNNKGINCIRFFSSEGIVVWGARTLADPSSDQKYVPVRRTTIMIEQSIVRSTRWAVFEPNDKTLWKTIRSAVTGFLTTVYQNGALMGATAEEAFFVKCDNETNTEATISLGQVNTVIGIAPVKPAEFIIFKIGQQAAGADVQTL